MNQAALLHIELLLRRTLACLVILITKVRRAITYSIILQAESFLATKTRRHKEKSLCGTLCLCVFVPSWFSCSSNKELLSQVMTLYSAQ